jgi:glutathione S-transferase
VLWTCEEAGIAYQQEDYGSGFASTETDAFRALNPNAMVPVLIDGDFVLWESNSICRYLARKAGRHDLLPAEPQACANVERWMDWQATEFNNAWRYVFLGWGVKTRTLTTLSVLRRNKEWNHCITILENQLQRTGAFAAGETFTLADVVLGCR